MPFTANRQFKAQPAPARRAPRACTTTADDGRQMLDGTAGLWCVNAGHGRPQIVEAMQRRRASWTSRRRSRWATRSRSSSPTRS